LSQISAANPLPTNVEPMIKEIPPQVIVPVEKNQAPYVRINSTQPRLTDEMLELNLIEGNLKIFDYFLSPVTDHNDFILINFNFNINDNFSITLCFKGQKVTLDCSVSNGRIISFKKYEGTPVNYVLEKNAGYQRIM